MIDFDKVTRDPGDPKKFLAAYDSCDHLHPSDAGYKAMADAIDLALFKTARPGVDLGVAVGARIASEPREQTSRTEREAASPGARSVEPCSWESEGQSPRIKLGSACDR